MFGITDALKLPLAAAAGALGAFLMGAAYIVTIHDPSIRQEARLAAEAEAMQRTEEAIDEITDVAEKTRALLRLCISVGRLWDFENNKCGDP